MSTKRGGVTQVVVIGHESTPLLSALRGIDRRQCDGRDFAQLAETMLSGTPIAGETWTLVLTTDYAATFTLSGVPELGDVWTVTVAGTPYAFTVDAADMSLADVGVELAGLINTGAAADASIGFRATVDGTSLTDWIRPLLDGQGFGDVRPPQQ